MALGDRLEPLNRPEGLLGGFGLGCAPIGDLFTSVTEADATDTVATALASGIRFFDTAPHYGAGLSERRLGRALRGAERDTYSIATKVGRQIVGADGEVVASGGVGVRSVGDLTGDGVLRSLESSLVRLGLDRIDVLYLHDPEDVDVALEQAIPAMQRLRAEGVVRSIGVGMNYTAPLARFAAEADVDLVMVAGRYTLLDRSAEGDLLPVAEAHGVDVIAAGVFNTGILADPSDDARYDYRPATAGELGRARAMKLRCSAHGVRLAAAAIRFPLRHPAVTGAVVGARTADEVRQFAVDAQATIPAALWNELDG
jgi:D-threo-aldose 1-dehydrogenase